MEVTINVPAGEGNRFTKESFDNNVNKIVRVNKSLGIITKADISEDGNHALVTIQFDDDISEQDKQQIQGFASRSHASEQ